MKCKNCGHEIFYDDEHDLFWHGNHIRKRGHNPKTTAYSDKQAMSCFCGCSNPEPEKQLKEVKEK